MPQSVHDRAAEIHNIPEHTAATAATNQKTDQVTAHEQTVQSEDHSHSPQKLASKLTHGKAAALESERAKE